MFLDGVCFHALRSEVGIPLGAILTVDGQFYQVAEVVEVPGGGPHGVAGGIALGTGGYRMKIEHTWDEAFGALLKDVVDFKADVRKATEGATRDMVSQFKDETARVREASWPARGTVGFI